MPRPSLALLAAGASLLLAVPAHAQHHGHMPGMTMPAKKAPAKKAAPKKRVVKKAPARKAPTKKAVVKAPIKKAPAKKPATRKAPPAKAVDPHAGHVMPATPPAATADPHAGHDMSAAPDAAAAGTDLPAGNAPPPPAPADHAAERVYGAAAMEMGRHHLDEHHGGQKVGQVMFNLAELQLRRGRDGFAWDGEAWYGGDIDRLWVKTEGEGDFGRSIEQAEVQALWSHAIDPYFNVQAGVRYDFKPDPSRVYAVLGVEGLAPSFFDVEGALFLSNKGELMARAEGYYDQRITQRLILQPRAELNFAAQDSRELDIGSGLSDAEVGLRLRYDIRREFAPYLGVQYRRAFGDTRRFLRSEGESPSGWSLITGVRTWF